jgi:hypothetical protein
MHRRTQCNTPLCVGLYKPGVGRQLGGQFSRIQSRAVSKPVCSRKETRTFSPCSGSAYKATCNFCNLLEFNKPAYTQHGRSTVVSYSLTAPTQTLEENLRSATSNAFPQRDPSLASAEYDNGTPCSYCIRSRGV